MIMRTNTGASSVVAVACVVAWSVPASALTISTIDHIQEHHDVDDLTISRANCEASTPFEISIGDSNGGDSLTLWVSLGADCTPATTRTGATQVCYQIGLAFNVAGAETHTVLSSDIAHALPGITACIDSQNQDAARDIKVYLLVNEGGADLTLDTDAFLLEGINLDLVGPNAPTEVTAEIADDNALLVKLTPPTTPSLKGVRAYCSLSASVSSTVTASAGGTSAGGAASVGGAGGTGGMGGAAGGLGMAGAGGVASGGAGGTAGGGAASSSTATTGAASTGTAGGGSGEAQCVAEDGDLVAGALPSATLVQCGDESGAATDIIATGLTNGQLWAVAVAAVDTLDNVGPLSELACAVPEGVTDFFEQYRNAGGQAGGGFCNCGVVGAQGRGALAVWAAGMLLLLFGWRRRWCDSGGAE